MARTADPGRTVLRAAQVWTGGGVQGCPRRLLQIKALIDKNRCQRLIYLNSHARDFTHRSFAM